MPASQPRRFANDRVFGETAPADTPDASPVSEAKAPVIPFESAGVQRTGESYKLRQWVERNKVILRLDWIAMAAAIALLPIGAIFLVHTNKIFPRSLEKVSGRTGNSVPRAQTPMKESIAKVQDKAGLASAGSADKPDHAGIVSDIRYTSDSASAVVTVDVDQAPKFEVHRLGSPQRIYLDLQKTKLAPVLSRKEIQTHERLLRAIRVGEHEGQTTRITLATAEICDYSVTRMPNSSQLRIELRKAQSPENKSSKVIKK